MSRNTDTRISDTEAAPASSNSANLPNYRFLRLRLCSSSRSECDQNRLRNSYSSVRWRRQVPGRDRQMPTQVDPSIFKNTNKHNFRMSAELGAEWRLVLT